VQDVPLFARAMTVAGDTLFIAGPPDVLDEEEAQKTYGSEETQAKLKAQDAALAGAQGAILLAVSTTDGKTLAEHKLASIPAWDGMAAAAGKLYMTTMDGAVVCMAAK